MNLPVSGLLGRVAVEESSSRGFLPSTVTPGCGSVAVLDRANGLRERSVEVLAKRLTLYLVVDLVQGPVTEIMNLRPVEVGVGDDAARLRLSERVQLRQLLIGSHTGSQA